LDKKPKKAEYAENPKGGVNYDIVQDTPIPEMMVMASLLGEANSTIDGSQSVLRKEDELTKLKEVVLCINTF